MHKHPVILLVVLALAACTAETPQPPPPREPTGGSRTRFCGPGENPRDNLCREWSADQRSGTVGRGYQDED